MKSRAKIVGNFSGFGSGKTSASYQDCLKHLLITPNGNALVGANVTSQYEQTFKRDFEMDCPAAFVRKVNIQKSYLDFYNGARLIYRPFDDPDKLRSYNLSYFVILEASEVTEEALTILRTRLRQDAAIHGNADWRKGIVESNPDPGWIKQDVLDVSQKIIFYGESFQPLTQDKSKLDPTINSVVSDTAVNPYLPKNFVAELARNKPKWWIERYLKGSFLYAEGLVYPEALSHVVQAFDPPRTWRRMVAFDYGLHDDAVWLFLALDEDRGILYAYKEVRTSDTDIDGLAQLYFDNSKDILPGALLGSILGDPKSLAKRDYNKRTLQDLFVEKGIYMIPGAVSVDARVLRTNAYFRSGKLKIMDSCWGLIEELKEYKFPSPATQNKSTARFLNKPIDKNNHAINPLEWAVMELPDDPRQMLLGVYNKYGRRVISHEENVASGWLPHALQDDVESANQGVYFA